MKTNLSKTLMCNWYLILMTILCTTGASRTHADDLLPAETMALTPETLWDVDRLLNQTPTVRFGEIEQRDGCTLQQIWYEAEPFRGRKTEVFAWLGLPDDDKARDANGKYPAVLLIHGGGGKAFDAWTEHWAKRGYVALAMDLAGCGPDGQRHAHPGPGQNHSDKFCDFDRNDQASIRDVWTYHAISDVLIAHALLAARDDVDAERIAATGISWGGYLTCILSGVDQKLAAAVPVYGCGFLSENGLLLPDFAQMSEQKRADWVALFGPSRYLGKAKCPMLFLNGTNDLGFPLDSYKKSYDLVKDENPNVTIAVEIKRPHSHIWTFPEVDALIDMSCKPAKPLPSLPRFAYGEQVRYCPKGSTMIAVWEGDLAPKDAVLCYTNDVNWRDWLKQEWVTVPAEIRGNEISATVPGTKAAVAYILATDEFGRKVSTPHHEFPDGEQYVVFEGTPGKAGNGKHIVLVSGDEEYRSEQMQTQLAEILSQHHGFRCTVLYAIDPNTGEIDPVVTDNIPGLETLETADLMVMFLRFRNLPDEQMQYIVRYLESGKPLIGLRTSTHAFNIPTDRKWASYSFQYRDESGTWNDGFGRRVLGETWIDHHGHHKVEATRGIIAPGAERHPIVTNCGDVFCPTDVYTVRLPLPDDSEPLVLGQVLTGMQQTDQPVENAKNDPMMPVLWTKSYQVDNGQTGRVVTSTMGAGLDMQSEGFRRLMVNSCYWLLDMATEISPDMCVDIVGDYQPLDFGFGQSEKGVKPADLAK